MESKTIITLLVVCMTWQAHASVNNTLTGNGTDATSICIQEGFIANPSATDCRSYIQCQRWNGTLVGTVQVCWNNTFFDPKMGFCSSNYTCEGSNITLPGNNGTDIDNSTSICIQEGSIANPSATDCRSYIQCQRWNGTLVGTVQVCWNNTFFDPIMGFCSSNYTCESSNITLPGNNGTDIDNSTSICIQEGSIANPSATDCRSYIQCQRWNGTLVGTVQVCWNNTFFDPIMGFCSSNYTCESSNITLPGNNGTDIDNSTSICIQEGSIANPSATDCRSYIQCQRWNGTLVGTVQVCWNNTFFDPIMGFCSSNYTCEGSNSTLPGNNGTDIDNSTSICIQEGSIANPNATDCRSYIQCQRWNGTLVGTVQVCWNNTFFDPKMGFCSSNYTCEGSNITLPGNNGTDIDNSTSICIQEGSIANPNATDCRSYIQCQRWNGTLVGTVQVCWNNTFFDPIMGFCSSNYTCESSNITLPGNNGTDIDNSTSICIQEGSIANPSATDCRSYIQCQRWNGTLVGTVQVCWNNTFFDPIMGFCSSNYTCESSNITLPGNNGTDIDNSTSICIQEGSIANPSATDCRSYIQCQRWNGTLVGTVQVCWNNTFFDPIMGFCSSNYTCEGSNSTLPGNNGTDIDNSTSICIQEGSIANPNATDCRSYIQCQRWNGTLVGTVQVCWNNTFFDPKMGFCSSNYTCETSNITLPGNNGTDSQPFVCASAGQFSDVADKTCRSFFLCIEGVNGTFIKHDYTCPTPSLFNPDIGFCTTSYTCSRSSAIGWLMEFPGAY